LGPFAVLFSHPVKRLPAADPSLILGASPVPTECQTGGLS
jgi:hypothetical protein